MEFKIPNKFILGGIEHSVEMAQKLEDNVPSDADELLIGRHITWEDEPVEIKEYKRL